MKVEKWKIKDLKPAEYNPRITLTKDDREYQALVASIETFGYVNPIIVNKDGTVIGGHQRLNVLKEMKYKDVDVVVLDLDKTKEKALNIALNKIAGKWDEQKLAELLDELHTTEYIMATGIDENELEAYLALLQPVEGEEEAPPEEEEEEEEEKPSKDDKCYVVNIRCKGRQQADDFLLQLGYDGEMRGKTKTITAEDIM